MINSTIIKITTGNHSFKNGDSIRYTMNDDNFLVLDATLNDKQHSITLTVYKHKKYRFKWMQRIWNWLINFRHKHGLL